MRQIELGDLMPSKTPSLDPSRFPDETFELWSIPAFDAGQPEIAPSSAIGSAKKLVQPNDVLLSRIVPHIRRSWVVGPLRGHRQIASGEWMIFRGNQFHPDYLRHILVSAPFHSDFMQTVAGVGGSLLRARPDGVRSIKIPLPPLEEQKRIAAILDQADALRRLRARALDRLNALGQAIFHEMFLTNLDDASSLLLSEVVYFQEGPGVRNWQFRDDGIKLINVGNIVDGHLNLGKTNRYLDPEEVKRKYTHFMLDPGDFVLASSGVTWGKIAEVFEDHLPLCLNTSMIRLRPKDSRVLRGYLRGFVEMGNFRSQIDRLITGSAQPNFGPSHLKQVMIPVPKADDQAAFEQKIAGISELSATARLAIATSEALFTALQHRAFRGEL